MVTIDGIIRGIRRIFSRTGREISDTIEEFDGLGQEVGFVPEGEELTTFEFRQKFISGLFYCGGSKRQFFARTFEQNDTDRTDDLLRELEDAFRDCSDIRENFGFESVEVPRSQVDSSFIFPNVEVGEL